MQPQNSTIKRQLPPHLHQKTTVLSVKNTYNSTSKYLRAEDFGRKRKQVTVAGVSLDKLGEEEKICLEFEEIEQKLALNKTNARMMVQLADNNDNAEAWIGMKIILRPDQTTFSGKTVQCIRIDCELPEGDDAFDYSK